MAQDQYRILLESDWQLTDLYEFPHAYAQDYAFVYCFDSELSPRDRDRINYALESYPWGGGYSYVNIYTVLQNQIPRGDRPLIASISKSSPGWLDLLLNVDVAISIAKSVAALSGAATAATYAYKNIEKALSDIRINRKRRGVQDLNIAADEAKAMTSMASEMAKYLGFRSLQKLHEYTGNPEVTLKLLLAHYRRMLVLVEYIEDGKVKLPTSKKQVGDTKADN